MKRIGGTKPVGELARFASVPRDVRLTANGKAVVVVAILLAAAAVAATLTLTVVRSRQQGLRDLIARDGVAIEATISSVTVHRGDEPRTEIVYRYPTLDGPCEGNARLRASARRGVAEGGRIGIVYLRSQPSRSWVAGREPGMLPILVIPAVALVLLAGAGIIVAHLRHMRTLLAEGRFAQARILSTTKVRGKDHSTFRVEYEFTALSGQTVKATVERGRAPESIGAIVPVVYHRDNPRWNALYPLSLVVPAPH